MYKESESSGKWLGLNGLAWFFVLGAGWEDGTTGVWHTGEVNGGTLRIILDKGVV